MTNPNPGPNPNPDEPVDFALTNADLGDLADQLGCTHCIGGFIPAGRHLILGLIYVACPACGGDCRCCNNRGLFPADSTCQHCLNDALITVGYTPVFCHTCDGVIAVFPTHEVTS